MTLPASQPPPDGHAVHRPLVTDVARRQALAWQAIFSLPNEVAVTAFQKVEMEARQRVINLDPATATADELRCALSAWKHARNTASEMAAFVSKINQQVEAESTLQKSLDKPGPPATMAGPE